MIQVYVDGKFQNEITLGKALNDLNNFLPFGMVPFKSNSESLLFKSEKTNRREAYTQNLTGTKEEMKYVFNLVNAFSIMTLQKWKKLPKHSLNKEVLKLLEEWCGQRINSNVRYLLPLVASVIKEDRKILISGSWIAYESGLDYFYNLFQFIDNPFKQGWNMDRADAIDRYVIDELEGKI